MMLSEYSQLNTGHIESGFGQPLVNQVSSRVRTWLRAADSSVVCVQRTCTQIITFSWHPVSCYVGTGLNSSLTSTFSGMGG